MIYVILYILDGFELFKANAGCTPNEKWGPKLMNKYVRERRTPTETECADDARSQGLKLFTFCKDRHNGQAHCFVYTKSKSVDTCTTKHNYDRCSIYRLKEGNNSSI